MFLNGIVYGGITLVILVGAFLVLDGRNLSNYHYQQGGLDILAGQVYPSGSIACDELPEIIQRTVTERTNAGVDLDRIRGQVDAQFQIVKRECGMGPTRIEGSSLPLTSQDRRQILLDGLR